jgi:hypothetical protein
MNIRLELTNQEWLALAKMGLELDLMPAQVLRQALRLYQAEHEKRKGTLPELPPKR